MPRRDFARGRRMMILLNAAITEKPPPRDTRCRRSHIAYRRRFLSFGALTGLRRAALPRHDAMITTWVLRGCFADATPIRRRFDASAESRLTASPYTQQHSTRRHAAPHTANMSGFFSPILLFTSLMIDAFATPAVPPTSAAAYTLNITLIFTPRRHFNSMNARQDKNAPSSAIRRPRDGRDFNTCN